MLINKLPFFPIFTESAPVPKLKPNCKFELGRGGDSSWNFKDGIWGRESMNIQSTPNNSNLQAGGSYRESTVKLIKINNF